MLLPTATATSHPGPVPTVIPTPPSYEMASDAGYRTLWVMFGLMLLSSATFTLASWNVPISKRIFYVITTMMSIIAALSYFAQASGHASSFACTTVREHHEHVPDTFHEVCRQVYWARYVDWALTGPLTVLATSLLAGIDGGHTLMAMVANVIMVLGGLFSAFGAEGTAQKWGWYTIACLGWVFTLWHVALHGNRMVEAKGARVKKLFGSLGALALLVWTAYPLVWGIAEGANKIGVNAEITTYAVLDALAKPVFGIWLLMAHRGMAETNADLDGYWSHGLAAEGRIRVGDEE